MTEKIAQISIANGIMLRMNSEKRSLINQNVVCSDKAIDVKELVKSKPIIKHRKKSFAAAKKLDKHNERAPDKQ